MRQPISLSTITSRTPIPLKTVSSGETPRRRAIKKINGEIRKMGKALSFSKEDVHLYSHILYTIFQQKTTEKIHKKAERFLARQLKLEEILADLITRHQFLKNHWKANLPLSPLEWKDITRQFSQLEEEVRIFNEMHFFVKRAYIRFTHEQFQFKNR